MNTYIIKSPHFLIGALTGLVGADKIGELYRFIKEVAATVGVLNPRTGTKIKRRKTNIFIIISINILN